MKLDTSKEIKIAILAEEPLGWGSGKHYFPIILDKYSWTSKGVKYRFKTEYIYDRDIIKGKLKIKNYHVLLVPGGGVGDGESLIKASKSERWTLQRSPNLTPLSFPCRIQLKTVRCLRLYFSAISCGL